MWAVFFGRGIIHPADQMNARNAPTHPELLDWLAKDFADANHDAHRLIRGLVLSKSYALGPSSHPPESFAGASERPLSAEQLARSWRVAAGFPPDSDPLRKAAIAAIPDSSAEAYNASFQQAQFLASSPALAELVLPRDGNTAARLAAIPDIRTRIRSAFTAVYAREPAPEETKQFETFLADRQTNPEGAVRDLLWALFTSAEFLTMP
jgi:hypothetical protein